MPKIETLRSDIRSLSGLHLWHARISNCSQRVRLILEEKGLIWVSHEVDLFRFEHATEEYQAIHPKGLVPTLVHDGITIIDSNDILKYVDETFSGSRFTAASNLETVCELLNLAATVQLSLRTLSHEFLFGQNRKLTDEQLDYFHERHRNSEFYQFLRKFSQEGFTHARLCECATEMDEAFGTLSAHLAQHAWLAGQQISLADLAWVVNVHRMNLIDFPLHRHPQLYAWFRTMARRPSYKAALTSYEGGLPTQTAKALERRHKFFKSCLQDG